MNPSPSKPTAISPIISTAIYRPKLGGHDIRNAVSALDPEPLAGMSRPLTMIDARRSLPIKFPSGFFINFLETVRPMQPSNGDLKSGVDSACEDHEAPQAICGNRLLKFLPLREYKIASRFDLTPMAR